MKGRSPSLATRVFAMKEGSVGISNIVVHELYYGAFKSSRRDENLQALRLLLQDLPTFDFEREDARVAGEVRAALVKRGTPIGPYDVLLAGQAKARDLTFVTDNVGEFSRVDGLRVEDWTRS